MKKFWIIWRENGGIPIAKHFDIPAARREAERLARQSPGSVFHVMECIDSCKIADVVWSSKSYDDSDIPF